MLNSAAKGNASTGAPIPLLRGIAADHATVAAIGGGSKATGGKGIVGGEKILSDSELKAQLATYGVKAAVIVAQVVSAMEFSCVRIARQPGQPNSKRARVASTRIEILHSCIERALLLRS
ncbi:hypothetical protein ACU8V6_00060 [Vibrio alginolyticus]